MGDYEADFEGFYSLPQDSTIFSELVRALTNSR